MLLKVYILKVELHIEGMQKPILFDTIGIFKCYFLGLTIWYSLFILPEYDNTTLNTVLLYTFCIFISLTFSFWRGWPKYLVTYPFKASLYFCLTSFLCESKTDIFNWESRENMWWKFSKTKFLNWLVKKGLDQSCVHLGETWFYFYIACYVLSLTTEKPPT